MRLSITTAISSLISITLAQQTQIVQVGANGLVFTPDTITAPIGSQVQFNFYPRNHSVVSSVFGNPCQPDGRIFSGYMPVSAGVGANSFVITITDTNPIWYYCSQNVYTHCQAGMVGVINPPSGMPGQSLGTYRAAAAGTAPGSSGDEPAVVGGVVRPLATASLSTTASPVSSASQSTASMTTVTNRACPYAGSKKRLMGREI